MSDHLGEGGLLSLFASVHNEDDTKAERSNECLSFRSIAVWLVFMISLVGMRGYFLRQSSRIELLHPSPIKILLDNPIPSTEMLTPPTLYIPEGFCRDLKEVICIVHCKVDDKRKRDYLRDQWLLVSPSVRDRVSFVFSIGRIGNGSLTDIDNNYKDAESIAEADKYTDIMIGNFKDSYANLALKFTSEFNTIENTCGAQYKYLIKHDTDVVVNWETVIHDLAIKMSEGLYRKPQALGARMPGSRIILDPSHPNHEPGLTYAYFPPYLSGLFQVLSTTAVKELLSQREKDHHRYRNDDAMLGILLENRAEIIETYKVINYDRAQTWDSICQNGSRILSCSCDWWAAVCQFAYSKRQALEKIRSCRGREVKTIARTVSPNQSPSFTEGVINSPSVK